MAGSFTIFDALAMIGHPARQGPGEQQVRCPFHAGGKEVEPSCRVYPDSDEIHCFACKRSWTAVQVVAQALEISEAQARRTLARNYGYHESHFTTARIEDKLAQVVNALANLPWEQRRERLKELDPLLAEVGSGADVAEVGKKIERWHAGLAPRMHFEG